MGEAAPEAQRNAFILMPFDPEFNDVWEMVRKPLEEVGYRVARADTDPSHGNVMRDIVLGIANADLVVADLTRSNANVFYELGLSHALNVPTILVTQQSVHDVPFDLRAYRIEKYSTSYGEAQRFQDKLREIGERTAANEMTFGNPVVDYLPERSRALERARIGPGVSPGAGEGRAEALDTFVRAISGPIEAVLDQFRDLFGVWGDEFPVFEQQQTAITAALAEEGESGRAVAVGLAAEAQRTLGAIAEAVSRNAPLLETRLERLTENVAALSVALDNATGYGPDTRARLVALRRGLAYANRASTNGLNATAQLRQQLPTFKGITPELDNTVSETVQALDAAASSMFTLQAFAIRAVALLEASLGPLDPSESELDEEPATTEDAASE